MNHVDDIRVDNWFVMNITAESKVINQTQNITIYCKFTLNGNETNESMLIPYFEARIGLISDYETINTRKS